MKLIWTKSNLVLSNIIRWGLETDCSHFALVFNSPAGGLMFESNLMGTHPKFFRNAQKSFEIVHLIELNLPIEIEDRIWDRIVDKYDSRDYDYPGFFYFAWRGLLKKVFKIPFPKKNKWAKDNAFLCDEVYKCLIEENIVPDLNIDLAITPPHEIYEKLSEYLRNKNG